MPNIERRQQDAAKVKAEAGRRTFDKLWTQRKAVNAMKKGIIKDDNRYRVHLQPISDEAREMLQTHPKYGTSPFVFTGEKGAQRGIHQIENSSRKIREAAGLPSDFRPNHGLRHTYASHLANSGEVDLYLLQRFLMHKDPKTTARYARLRDEVLKRGANVMGRIVMDAKEAA